MASEYAQRIPTLIPLEKAGPKLYARYILPLELPQDYEISEVLYVLRTGLEAAKERIPTLACEGVLDTEANQAGVLKLQKLEDYESIIYKDLRASFPHTFEELKEKRFPVSAFPGDYLCRRYTWPLPGDRLPVVDVQANFIQGGLLLNACFFHVFADVKTYYLMLQTWAEECRRVQEPSMERNEIPDIYFTDREKHMRSSGRNPGRPEDHPGIVERTYDPDRAPLKMFFRDHSGQIFYFSPENLQKLTADASPVNATEPTDVTSVSTNEAISALIWRSITAAQAPAGEIDDDLTSIFSVALDARMYSDPPVHPMVLGNWLGVVCDQMSMRKMLITANLADIAAVVHKIMLIPNDQYADDLSAMFEKVGNVNRILLKGFLDTPGVNCFETAFVDLDFGRLDWGKALGNHILATRVPDIGVINGGSTVFGVLPNGGMEMLIGLDSKYLPRLLSDPVLAKYTEAIIM
ncbi:hypothetical protein GGS26DRAFT_589569 [Hypomontagnella submonticulosa]|nr:hypothetical protein GGS26DRAFT_589569 [Hypomontagnella submonticulosa]